MLLAEGVGVSYGSVNAVRGATVRCARGEIVAIVGPNGAGKSSLLTAIAGGIEAGSVSGSVTLDDQRLLGRRAEAVVRAGVALVPEGRRIFPDLSVLENLRLGASVRKDRDAVVGDLEVQLTRFPILAERRHGAAGLLSGGEQQQLAIARALMSRPQVILLDEPSLGLAPLVVDQIFATVVELKNEGMGVVLVEQNARRAIACADHTYILRNGTIQREGTSADADALMAEYFGAATA